MPLWASMTCSMVINLAPKPDVSTLDYILENHCTKLVFMYIKKPFLDVQDTIINKYADVNIVTSRFWGIHGYSLLGILL